MFSISWYLCQCKTIGEGGGCIFWGGICFILWNRSFSDTANENPFAGIHRLPSSNKKLRPTRIWVKPIDGSIEPGGGPVHPLLYGPQTPELFDLTDLIGTSDRSMTDVEQLIAT